MAEARQAAPKVSAAADASQERCRRLEILIALRKMYRNVLRAQGLLAQPSPIYESEVFKPGAAFSEMVQSDLALVVTYEADDD